MARSAGFHRPLLTIFAFLALVFAHDHGDDMDMGGTPAMAQGYMIPYLHLKTGDTLFFEGWLPQTSGSVAGACIGLFLLGIVDRLLAATRSSAESFWSGGIARFSSHGRASYTVIPDKRVGHIEGSQKPSILAAARTTFSPPFTPANDITRGIIHVIQATLGFAFMLVVMTFHFGFILSVLVGLGVGETLFGRFVDGPSITN